MEKPGEPLPVRAGGLVVERKRRTNPEIRQKQGPLFDATPLKRGGQGPEEVQFVWRAVEAVEKRGRIRLRRGRVGGI